MGANGRSASPLWKIVQALGIVATVALVAGLLLAPTVTLAILWNLVVPLLPASFLLTPAIWRNACPVATLNMLPNRFGLRRHLAPELVPKAGVVAIVLLAVLVPARRFLLNTDGTAMAVTVLALGVGALALGLVYDAKAGFCGSFCPVLPVERLYGQSPLLDVGHARCGTCTSCTGSSCIDLAPTRVAIHMTGGTESPAAWLRTSFGLFAAAFPGFVIGYNTLTDSGLDSAGAVYLHMALWSLGSLVVAGLLVTVLRLRANVGLALLGAVAVTVYYWFAGPTIAEALSLPAWGGQLLRGLAFALIVVWLWRAMSRLSDAPARPASVF